MRRIIQATFVIHGALSMLAIIIIGLYNTWTPGSSADSGSFQSHLVDTWLILGLVPTLLLALAWVVSLAWEAES